MAQPGLNSHVLVGDLGQPWLELEDADSMVRACARPLEKADTSLQACVQHPYLRLLRL
jgi:hypothetical protein